MVIKFLGPAGDRMLTALDSAIVKREWKPAVTEEYSCLGLR